MHLTNTSYNPVPGTPKTGLVEAEVGVFLRYALWRNPTSSGKGTVLLLQGRGEYIEKNFELAADLISRGYDVLAFDWRGQGGSSRLLENANAGYVDSFDEYVVDLKAIIAQLGLPDCRAPLFIMAHSMGSLVALLAAPEISNKISRMVLCSPFLGIGQQRFSGKSIGLFSGALAAVGLGEVYLTARSQAKMWSTFEDNVYTTSKVRFERNSRFAREHPELCIGGATASWIFAACTAFERVRDPEFVRTISIPVLMINASADRVVDNVQSERFARGLKTGSVLTIEGARHEIWQEADFYREQMIAAFCAFIPGSGK